MPVLNNQALDERKTMTTPDEFFVSDWERQTTSVQLNNWQLRTLVRAMSDHIRYLHSMGAYEPRPGWFDKLRELRTLVGTAGIPVGEGEELGALVIRMPEAPAGDFNEEFEQAMREFDAAMTVYARAMGKFEAAKEKHQRKLHELETAILRAHPDEVRR